MSTYLRVCFLAFIAFGGRFSKTLVITVMPTIGIIGVVGCAASSGPEDGAEDTTSNACKTSENLLQDVTFSRQGEYARTWREAQHTGERSFSTDAVDGVLEIRRISSQPWMLFRQTVKDPRLSGATIRYTAELKADLPAEPRLHGFDHVGGLYLQLARGKVRLADHEPNHDQWEWQQFNYEESIPQGVTSLRLGFVHQAGGVLWAKNPSLVILDCP